MKKLLTLLLVVALTLSSFACSYAPVAPDDEGDTPSVSDEGVSENEETDEVTTSEDQITTAEIINNGGEFVEHDGNTYYWKRSADSCSNSETMASFSYLVGPSELVCRSESGEETVLVSAAADGRIYIAGERIYYYGAESSWYSVKFDGTDMKNHGKDTLTAVDEASGAVIWCDYVNQQFWRETDDGSRVVLNNDNVDSDGSAPRFLTVGNGKLYYSTENPVEDEKIVVAVLESDMDGNTRLVNTFTHTMKGYDGLEVEAVLHDDILYVSYANIGGTGLFYSFGGLVAMNTAAEQATEYLIRPDSETPLGHTKITVNPASDTDELRIFFYAGTGATARTSSITKDIKMLTPSTGRIHDVTYGIIVCDGSCGTVNGNLVTVNDKTGKQETIVSWQTLNDLGYSDFNGNGSETGGYMLDFASVVGNKVYLSVSQISRDTSKDMGWRLGYKRDKTTVYVTEMGSDKLTELYAY